MIRIATTSDAPAIALLHTQNWQTSYRGVMTDHYLDHEAPAERLQVWTDRFDQPSTPMQVAVVETADDKLMGFVCVFPNHSEKDGHLIDNLHVNVASRGLGLGKKLMHQAAQRLLDTDHGGDIYLWVLTSNTAAIGFYNNMGGRPGRTEIHTLPGNQQLEAMMISWKLIALAAGFSPD